MTNKELKLLFNIQWLWQPQILCWLHPQITTRINTLRPRQNGHNFPHDILKCIFFEEKTWISIKGQINNISALGKTMAWCRPGDKPLSEPMMFSLLTHECATRPQWVNSTRPSHVYMHDKTRSALVQVITCHLFTTKPLSKPMMMYCKCK